MILSHNNTFTQQKLIFIGNSLFNLAQNSSTILNGHYIPTGVYNSVRTGRTIAMTSHAVSGYDQSEINAELAADVIPFLQTDDILVNWEGTNDMGSNGLTGQQAFDKVVTMIEAVDQTGCQIVICTVIARDAAGDAAGVMDTEIPAYNTLVRNNAATYGYTVCDLAADAMFNARADASNATNYTADKVHLATMGQDRVVTLLSATLETIL